MSTRRASPLVAGLATAATIATAAAAWIVSDRLIDWLALWSLRPLVKVGLVFLVLYAVEGVARRLARHDARSPTP